MLEKGAPAHQVYLGPVPTSTGFFFFSLSLWRIPYYQFLIPSDQVLEAVCYPCWDSDMVFSPTRLAA